MKKIIFSALVLSLGGLSYGQVGVKTQKPIGVFNIDGARDNGGSTNPSAAAQLNDVTVLASGFTGIGVTNPTTRFHVVTGGTNAVGGAIPGIKIVDGNQSDKYIMTSDANGMGTWKYLDQGASTMPPARADLSSGVAITSDNSGAPFIYSGVTLHVPKGRYILNAGLRVDYTTMSPSITYASSYYLQVYISSSQSSITQAGFTVESITGNQDITFGGAIIRGPLANAANNISGNFMQGSTIIDVTNPAGVDLYMLIQNIPNDPNSTSGNSWSYTPNSGENNFYAIPLNPA